MDDPAVTPELLAACRRGDAVAIEEVVRRTHRQVYTLAVRLVRDRYEAEDVVQDSYLRALRGLPSFREDARFETWLYRIVTNTAMSHLRRRARMGELWSERDDGGPEIPAPTELEEETVHRDALSRALDALPAGMRSVVILKDVYGFSCAEIGEELGVSEGAIKVRLHRARKRLKESLFGREIRDEV